MTDPAGKRGSVGPRGSSPPSSPVLSRAAPRKKLLNEEAFPGIPLHVVDDGIDRTNTPSTPLSLEQNDQPLKKSKKEEKKAEKAEKKRKKKELKEQKEREKELAGSSPTSSISSLPRLSPALKEELAESHKKRSMRESMRVSTRKGGCSGASEGEDVPFPGIPLKVVDSGAKTVMSNGEEKGIKGENDAPFPGIPLRKPPTNEGGPRDAPFPGIPLHKERPASTSSLSDNSLNPSNIKPSPIFGVSLDDVLKFEAELKFKSSIPQQTGLPSLLLILASAVIQLGGCEKEGLFRASGTQTEMNELEEKLSKGDYDIPQTTDPHVVASILKKWVHSLRPPLIPPEHYSQCLSTTAHPEQSEKFLAELPDSHGQVIRFLVNYLQQEFLLKPDVQKKTRMDLKSLATTWSPCFFYTPDRDIQEMVVSMKAEARFLRNLLMNMNGVKLVAEGDDDSDDEEDTFTRIPLSMSEGDVARIPAPLGGSSISLASSHDSSKSSKLGRSFSSRFKRHQETSGKKSDLKRQMMEARKRSVSEAVRDSKSKINDPITKEKPQDL